MKRNPPHRCNVWAAFEKCKILGINSTSNLTAVHMRQRWTEQWRVFRKSLDMKSSSSSI